MQQLFQEHRLDIRRDAKRRVGYNHLITRDLKRPKVTCTLIIFLERGKIAGIPQEQ